MFFCPKTLYSTEEAGTVIVYLPRKQNLYRRELGRSQSYGIAAYRIAVGKIQTLAFVEDVSVQWRAVWKLSLAGSFGKLDPRQLRDVVEDWIGNC